MVFIKCVRFLLEAPLQVTARMLCDDSLAPESFDPMVPDSTLDIEESIKKMTTADVDTETLDKPSKALAEEEVWASELDEDDVPYDNFEDNSAQSRKTGKENVREEIGYGGQKYFDKVLTLEDCQQRLGYIIMHFSSSFLSGIGPHSWKKYNLVSDICRIIHHLSPSAQSEPSLMTRPSVDGKILSPRWVEEGWVEYTYALRDNVLSDGYDPSALEFLLSQLDSASEELSGEVMTPGRCISFVVLHSVVASRYTPPMSLLKKGLLERLDMISECIDSITDGLTVYVAAATKAAAAVQVGSVSEEEEPKENKALLYEQAKVLIVILGFALGVSLSPDSVCEAKSLTMLPPASMLVKSQVYRSLLKLVSVLTVKPTFKEGTPNPLDLGMQLIVMIVAQSSELAEFTIRVPMTLTLLEVAGLHPVLLSLSLAMFDMSVDLSTGRINEMATRKCMQFVDLPASESNKEAISLLASLSHWTTSSIRRLQAYLNSARGGWFRDLVLAAQQSITQQKTIAPTLSSDQCASDDIDDGDIDTSNKDKAEVKGPEKGRLITRSDALKGAKMLLEKTIGDNKTD
jgi:hypothetical protein